MFRKLLMATWLAAAALWVQTAHAQEPKINGLRVADNDKATQSVAVLPSKTDTFYVLFDYEGFANQKAEITLTSPQGETLFGFSKRYTGKGSEAIRITGSDIYQNITANLIENLSLVESSATDVIKQANGQQEYLFSTLQGIQRAKSNLGLLAKLQLDPGTRDIYTRLEKVVVGMDSDVTSAIALGADKVADKKAAADKVKRAAGDAQGDAKSLQDKAKTSSNVIVPESGVDARSTYTVQASVTAMGGQMPSGSVEFQVSNDKPLPPSATPTRPPDRTGPMPTQAPGASRTQVAAINTAASQSQAGATRTTAAAGAQPTAMPTGARATLVAQAMATNGPASTQTTTAANLAQPDQSQPGSAGTLMAQAGQPTGVPTWTPVPGSGGTDKSLAGAQTGDGPQGSVTPNQGDSNPGPNLAVLILGIAALGGAAWWIRQRM